MNLKTNHTSFINGSETLSFVWENRQDTIPFQQQPDTVKGATEGIDPLFLMIERKTQEVEAIKEEVIAQKKKLPPKVVVKQDTTCHICPLSDPLPLFSIVENNQFSENNFDLSTQYDKDFLLNQLYKTPVFVEIKDTLSSTKRISLSSSSKLYDKSNIDWIFFPLVALLFILGVVKIVFPSQLSTTFRSLIYFFLANKINKESSSIFARFNFLLDFIFIVSIPILTVLLVNYYQIWDYSFISIALATLVGLFLYRLYSFIFLKSIGAVTNNPLKFELIRYNHLIFPRITGIVLVPLLLLFAYSVGTLQTISLYIILLLMSLILILRTIRSFQVFIFNGFSIFYLILYLCALEIIPILVVIKEIYWE